MVSDFVPRRMDFHFQELPKDKYFYHGNSILSSLFIALTSIFPEGEKQFVLSVRHFQDRVTDPKQMKEVRAFIGQESHHAHTHQNFNEQIEEQWGYPISEFVQSQANRQKRVHRKFSKEAQLGLTSALEHLTAILSNQIIINRKILEVDYPEFAELFTWHAIEEIEHKGVAFDLYKTIGGDEKTRKKMLVLGSIGFVCHLTELVIKMHIRDRHMPSFKEFKQAFKSLFGKQGIVRKMWPDYKDYYRADFHPWDHDNSNLIEDWENEYPEIHARNLKHG
jgi:predicted metal-dependent hydrolase